MIEKNKDYYIAQVKKLKAKNKELKEESNFFQGLAGAGWGLSIVLSIILILKCL